MSRFLCKLISSFLLGHLLLSLGSCAALDGAKHQTTTPTTTTATAEDPFAHLRHPCQIPEGYVYPKGTAQYYIDNGIWLADDFNRPDIIWTGPGIIDDMIPQQGTIRYSSFPEDKLSYPDNLRAFTLHFYSETDETTNDKLIAYLTGEGFELLGTDTKTNRPIFAGTGRAIEALDCTAIQNAVGCSTEYGIDIGFQRQTYHTHSEPLPEGKFWSCGYADVYIVPQE